MGIVSEEMTFIRRDGNRIRGRIYLPEEKDGKLPLVIFCHGFGSNYRELMHHGNGFAEAGICCLFFDFCGGGPESLSDGKFEEMTVGTECGDLETVISCVKDLDYWIRVGFSFRGRVWAGWFRHWWQPGIRRTSEPWFCGIRHL